MGSQHPIESGTLGLLNREWHITCRRRPALTRSGISIVLSCVARSRRPDLLTVDRARALAGYVRGALPLARN